MPSNAYRDRTFPPAEVRRILRHAAELDAATTAPSSTGRGHTLEELERIAGDAGISEAALRRAIAGEVAPSPSPERAFSLAPDPGTLSIERTVRGEVHASQHEELAKAMRGAVGVLGDARSTGDALRWSSAATGGRKVHAIVEPSGEGRVTVRVDEDLRTLRGGIFSGSLVVAFLLFLPIIALVGHVGVPYALLGWVVCAYLAAWVNYGRRFATREAQLRAMVAQVLAVAEAPRSRVASEDEAAGLVRVEGEAEVEEEGGEEGGGKRRARGGT